MKKVRWVVVISKGSGTYAVSRFHPAHSKRAALAMIEHWKKSSNSADESAELRRNGVKVA